MRHVGKMTRVLVVISGVLVVGGCAPHQEMQQVRVLVEQLSSEDIETRDEATLRLKHLAAAATGELTKATHSADSELASRARYLLRWIEIDSVVSVSIKRAIPSVTDLLVNGEDQVWTQVVLQTLARMLGIAVPPEGLGKMEITALQEGITYALLPNHAGKEEATVIDWGAFTPLTVRAIRGARSSGEKIIVCRVARKAGNPLAIPPLQSLLSDSDGNVRGGAAVAIGELRAKSAIQDLVRQLHDSHPAARVGALVALEDLKAQEAISSLAVLMRDQDFLVRYKALHFAISIAPKDLLASICRCYIDPTINTILHLRDTWIQMGGQELIPHLTDLLRNQDPSVRRGAQAGLRLLKSAP